MTKQNIKEDMLQILNKYEMTGAYIEGAKRHEYNHLDELAKEHIVREAAAYVEKACEGLIDTIAAAVNEKCVWAEGQTSEDRVFYSGYRQALMEIEQYLKLIKETK